MAATTATLVHPTTGIQKKAPIGFSWTTFFFSFFPAVFRSDWKNAILMLVLSCLTMGLAGLVFCFIYNKRYALGLIEKGYEITDGGKLTIEEVKARLGIAVLEPEAVKEAA
ncbi:hypothetical protein [Halodesulfovibrio aestuarii]|uniref:hypothetical protein n=1 Tax=Halodesulfovibrio aestuarii TaxID=126333 RepID=UPI00040130B9